jgi:hypothetical protein
MTVVEWISDALMALGVMDASDAPAPADMNLGLRTGNRLIGAWSVNRLLIYSITRTVWTLTAGTASYTVGTGGDIDIPRPNNMEGNGANVRVINTTQSPTIELGMTMLTDDTYQAVIQKTYSSTYPTSWYYNPTYTQAAPYGTLTFWPIPNVDYLQGVFYSPAAVQQVAIGDTLYVPPEWGRFLVTNLAMELAMFFPAIRPSDELQLAARESKGDVERTNLRLTDLAVDLALQPIRDYENFYTGGSRG